MTIGKIEGSTDGVTVTLGNMIFVYSRDRYHYIKDFTLVTYDSDLTPLAFKPQDKAWVISMNETKYITHGIILNLIDKEKEDRVNREVFLEEYKEAYREALSKEILAV